MHLQRTFDRLGLTVFERGWLSSNSVLFRGGSGGAALVDSGYATHAQQTIALVEHALADQTLMRVVNTHLHSDHCGGNAALHARWNCRIVVPRPSFDAASRWDEDALTFTATGQRCDPFPVHDALRCGDTIELGTATWEVHAAPGHDPDAVMLYQRDERVLISGDALWQHRVAIVFPELMGKPGFGPAMDALDAIEELEPHGVIPGHGTPFLDVAAALSESRSRLRAFAREPEKHRQHAARALIMFHMLEHRRQRSSDVLAWARSTAMMRHIAGADPGRWAQAALERLLADDVLRLQDGWIHVSPPPSH